MKVRKVQLHNVRLIKDMELSLNDKRVTILLGENGKGKTTLLDSIALCANVFTSTFPGIKKRNPSPWDIHINEQNEVSDYLSIRTTFSFDENHTIEVERFLRRDSLVTWEKRNCETMRYHNWNRYSRKMELSNCRFSYITARSADGFRLPSGTETSKKYSNAGTATSMLRKPIRTSNVFSNGSTIRKTWNVGKK